MFGLCALAALWLYHAIHTPPRHEPRLIEMADAAVVFLSWSLGGASLTVGPGLFRLIQVPARHARFATTKGPTS